MSGHPVSCVCRQCVPNTPPLPSPMDPKLEAEFRKFVAAAQPAAKPCACAPGCGNMVTAFRHRLCSDCQPSFWRSAACDRWRAAATEEAKNRHLSDWARLRSAELTQERLSAKDRKPSLEAQP